MSATAAAGATAAVIATAAPTSAGQIGTVLVDSASPTGATSSFSLTAGTTYVLEVTGSYSYGFQGGIADAECSTLPPDNTYQRNRYAVLDPNRDLLDLLVEDRSVEWQAVNPDALGCDGSNHRYRVLHTPDSSGPISLRVDDTGYSDNQGFFTVQVSTDTEVLVDSVAVWSGDPFGAATSVALDPAKAYRFEVSGTYTFGFLAGTADAECADPVGVVPMTRNAFGLLKTPTNPDDDPLDLVVDDAFVEWQSVEPADLAGCAADHVYDIGYQVPSARPVVFRVDDDNYADNLGTLTVDVYELAVPPEPPPSGVPRVELVETVQVDSADPNGARTLAPLTEGESFMFEVTGTYSYGLGAADAECSNRLDLNDPTFRREQDFGAFSDPRLLDLLVDSNEVDWVAPDADGEGCDGTGHRYRLVHVPTTTDRTHFVVFDTHYGDNTGTLTVKVFRITEIPVGSVSVDSREPNGANTLPLAPGQRYRFEASGTYFYGLGFSTADAECSNLLEAGDPVYRRDRFILDGNDLLDLDVNRIDRNWDPLMPTAEGCSADNTYTLTLTAPGGPVNLGIDDISYTDNLGSLTVEVFLRTS